MYVIVGNRTYRSEAVDPPSLRYSIIENSVIERHDDSLTRHIAVRCEETVTHFFVRVIFKETREKLLRRASSDHYATAIRGNESISELLAMREHLSHPNILPLYAVRDTQSFIFLCWTWNCCMIRSRRVVP